LESAHPVRRVHYTLKSLTLKFPVTSPSHPCAPSVGRWAGGCEPGPHGKHYYRHGHPRWELARGHVARCPPHSCAAGRVQNDAWTMHRVNARFAPRARWCCLAFWACPPHPAPPCTRAATAGVGQQLRMMIAPPLSAFRSRGQQGPCAGHGHRCWELRRRACRTHSGAARFKPLPPPRGAALSPLKLSGWRLGIVDCS
jgi:hypothetical protein